MTPQRPAAPETETDANGLTKAVTFAPMRPAPLEEAWPLGDQDGYAIRLCTCEEGAYLGARLGGTPCRCERCGFITLDQWEHIVERIVAERVRVVEGERDDLMALAVEDTRRRGEAIARAESAEAAHEAEKAAHERLRAELGALHVKTPVFQFAEDCPNEEHEHSEDENGDPICRECGVVRHECSFCLDDAWDGIHSDWPCSHALLLGGGEAR